MFLQFWLGVREHLQVLNSSFVLSNNDFFIQLLKKIFVYQTGGKFRSN